MTGEDFRIVNESAGTAAAKNPSFHYSQSDRLADSLCRWAIFGFPSLYEGQPAPFCACLGNEFQWGTCVSLPFSPKRTYLLAGLACRLLS